MERIALRASAGSWWGTGGRGRGNDVLDALCGAPERISRFYKLSACHIALPDLPAEITRKLPPYPAIRAVRAACTAT